MKKILYNLGLSALAILLLAIPTVQAFNSGFSQDYMYLSSSGTGLLPIDSSYGLGEVGNTWAQGHFTDLYTVNVAVSGVVVGYLDLDGNYLYLDSDRDTSIDASIDDTISVVTPGGTGYFYIGDGSYSWDHAPNVGIEGALEVDGKSYFDDQVVIASHLTGSGSYLKVGTGSASWPAVSGENDAYVTNELEVDGILYMDGTALLRGDTGSTGGAQLYFNEASTLASSLRADFGRDQLLWTSGSALGKQLILTDHDNRARDHDRPEGSNPWIYVFSSTNVDTVSDQWIGISFDPTIPGAVIDTGSGTVRIDAAFSLKVSATTSLVDDDTIDCNDDAVMRITGSGASVLLDTDPAIADGLTDGQLCEIEAASDTNLVTIADNVNTELDNGLQFIMGQGDQLVFRWNADDGTWYEKSRSDN